MRKFKDLVILIIQISMVPIFVPYSKFLGIKRRNIEGLEKLGKRSLIIANHQTRLDPFMILAQFPFRTFIKMIPIRFPIAHKEYKKYKCLRIFGGYDIGETKKEKMLGLYRTRQYLSDGYSIMIFPEGKLSKSDELGDLQLGVSFLMDQADSVLFVKMAGFNYNRDRRMTFGSAMKVKNKKIDEDFLRKQFVSLSV